MEEKVLNDYEALLESANNENEVQRFLESNSALVPKKFMENHGISQGVIISKLPIGNKFSTDFAFVTKCSQYWNIVLIEIEDPRKQMFTGSDTFSSKFIQAQNQVQNWKGEIEHNPTSKKAVIDSLNTLLIPFRMTNNPINFKYVLVYGRSKEIDSECRKRLFTEINQSADMAFVTYDRLKSPWECQHFGDFIIANIVAGNKLSIKKVPDNDPCTQLFTVWDKNKIVLKPEDKEKLKTFGYEMDDWENGYSLRGDGGKKSLLHGGSHDSTQNIKPIKLAELDLRYC